MQASGVEGFHRQINCAADRGRPTGRGKKKIPLQTYVHATSFWFFGFPIPNTAIGTTAVPYLRTYLANMDFRFELASLTKDLTPSDKSRLDEAATLMLEIYQILAQMRYLDTSWIQPGPHDLSPSILSLYTTLKLDPKIIYLYSVLPYIDPAANPHGSDLDFFQGSSFADFRTEHDVVRARDPMCSEEDSEKLRPWMTTLCNMVNHQSVLIYDAERHVVGIYDQCSPGSYDRNIHEGVIFGTTDEDGTKKYLRKLEDGTEEEVTAEEYERSRRGEEGNDGEEEGGEDGDDHGEGGEDDEESVAVDGEGQNDEENKDEQGNQSDDENEEDEAEDEDEDEDEEEENRWDEMDARPAPNVLRDIARWYRQLIEAPGGGEYSGSEWDEETTRPLYIKHGWLRGNFDGDAFLADQARAVAMEHVNDDLERPAREVRTLKYRIEEHEKGELEAREERQKRLAVAENPDEEWAVRWEEWQQEWRGRKLREKLKAVEQKAAEGEPTTAEALAVAELKYFESEIAGHREDSAREAARPPVLKRAYAACLADFERLYPSSEGGGVPKRELFAVQARKIEDCEREADDIRAWVAGVPEGATAARKLAEDKLVELVEAGSSMSEERRLWLARLEALILRVGS